MSCEQLTDYSKVTFPGGYSPWKTRGGCTFDADAAQTAVDFFPEFLIHVKGGKGQQPFCLEPWQQNIIATLFGWKRSDGWRRYRDAYIEVARGNGKSLLSAGIVCLLLYLDDEPGADIYSAAGTRAQAKEVFGPVRLNVLSNPALDECSTCYVNTVTHNSSRGIPRGTYHAVSADADFNMGGSSHGVIFDELHVQKNRNLWDTLHTGKVKRDQPLTIAITTAGYDRTSICYEQHDYARKVRDGEVDDDLAREFLPVIYAADEEIGDDWTDPAVWAKANPNMGVSVKEEDLAKLCARAKVSPGFENTFKRLHLNIWTEQRTRFIQMAAWSACAGEVPDDLPAEACYAGLDLASKRDLTAYVRVWQQGDVFYCKPTFFIPRNSAREMERKTGIPFMHYMQTGDVIGTGGNECDFAEVRRIINELGPVVGIAFDPWNATQIAQELGKQDGYNMVEFRQGMRSFNEPTKFLNSLIVDKKLQHGDHPVMDWCASNVEVETDTNDNIRPVKGLDDSKKIEGIVSLIMAIGLAIKTGQPEESVYMTRGIRSF